jgi:hypothetical protein
VLKNAVIGSAKFDLNQIQNAYEIYPFEVELQDSLNSGSMLEVSSSMFADSLDRVIVGSLYFDALITLVNPVC